MSYDLTFARPKGKIPHERLREAYDALSRDEPSNFFEPLPVDKILDALCEAYEDFEPAAKFPSIEDGRGFADVFHDPYRFSFTFRGDSADLTERIAGIFRGFGCPAYDPQIAKLHALDSFPEKMSIDSAEAIKGITDIFRGFGRLHDPQTGKVHDFGDIAEQIKLDLMAWMPPKDPELAAQARQARLEHIKRQRRSSNPEWCEAVDRLAAQIARDCAGGRWQRLGIDAENCAAVLHNMTLMGPSQDQQTPDNLVLMAKMNLVFLAFLGAIPPGHAFSDPKAVARAGVVRAIEFCYGAWRDSQKEFFYSVAPMSRAETRAKLGWITPYREGLFLALYVDDESAIRRLIDWPDTDLPIDDGMDNRTAGDNHAQILLAFLLRGEEGEDRAGYGKTPGQQGQTGQGILGRGGRNRRQGLPVFCETDERTVQPLPKVRARTGFSLAPPGWVDPLAPGASIGDHASEIA
jgi:hypothetical protein